MTERYTGQFHSRARIAVINTANQVHVIEAHNVYKNLYNTDLGNFVFKLCKIT